jgi:hypothetical protein
MLNNEKVDRKDGDRFSLEVAVKTTRPKTSPNARDQPSHCRIAKMLTPLLGRSAERGDDATVAIPARLVDKPGERR